MRKKIIALVLIFIISISLLMFLMSTTKATYTCADGEGNIWTYTLDGDEAIDAYISGYENKNLSASFMTYIDIPSSLDGHAVTSIGGGYFKPLISKADYRNLVHMVKIPDTVKKINDRSFYGCTELNKITIPNSITKIGHEAFCNTGFVSIEIPNTVIEFGSGVFSNCQNLKKVKLSDKTTNIPSETFANCKSLKNYEVPNTVTKLGESVFENCISLKDVTIPDTITEIPDKAFKGCSSLTLENVNLNNIVKIGIESFSGCGEIINLKLSDSLQKIERNAFENCTGIKTIDFGTSLTSIGSYAFYNCYNLESLKLPDSLKEIKNSAFMECTKISGDIVIPDSVVTLEREAFYDCSGAKGKLVVGEGVEKFEINVFNLCQFSKIVIKGKNILIRENAFDSSVTDIYIEQNKDEVKIGENKFLGRIHYKNCNHNVNFSANNGIKFIDKSTGKELITGNYQCGLNIEFYLDINEDVNLENARLISSSIDSNGNTVVDKVIELKEYNGEIFRINKLLEDKKLVVIVSYKSNLTLRTYIEKINNKEVGIDRKPVISNENGEFVYKHTKVPVVAEPEDIITYKIRIYNEGIQANKVTKIKSYIPNGLDFIDYDPDNIQYGWNIEENDRRITTEYLKNEEIAGYEGSGELPYKEISLTLKVTNKKELEDVRLVNIVEIESAIETDRDSNYDSIKAFVGNDYKKDEAINSKSESYIRGQEDDDDFENIVIPKDTIVSYQLEIKKIDIDTKELLNGAEFELLDENKNVLKTGVTEKEGIIDFGIIKKPGEGTDIYYLSESKTPEGYEKLSRDSIKLEVTRKIVNAITGEYQITVDSNVIETDKKEEKAIEYIPISTREQLEKIGTNETVIINGKSYVFSENANYELENDINLEENDWVPIKNFNGKFNGNNKSISNMQINVKSKLDLLDIGLFGKATGEISNLNMLNVKIDVVDMAKDLVSNTVTDDKKEEKEQSIKERLDSIHIGSIVGYFENGTIRNCSVDGKIVGDANSVGGLIGYINGYALITKCTNNARIIGENSNVGGLVGFANNTISMISCINNGEVSARYYNVGGLIGFAKTGEYEQKNVNVAYVNSKILIIIENKKISDKYQLILENRDIQNLGLLKNGKFNIYDVNKNIKYENLTLLEGSLKVADIDINTLGTDTYYIEQKEAQSSYGINNKYVKLIVEKKWDGQKEEYTTNVNYTVLSGEEFSKEVEKDESYNTSNSGKYFEGTNIDTETQTAIVTSPVMDTLNFKDCKNTGNVKLVASQENDILNLTVEKPLNAAGIIGKTQGNLNVQGCTNEGIIESKYRSSGIVSETTNVNDDETVLIENCENKGKVISELDYDKEYKSDLDTSYNCEESAGIMSWTENVNVNVINSKNIGEIQGNTAGGIISNAQSNIVLKGCYNEGSITGIKSSGIIAQAYNVDANINIIDCHNNNDISGLFVSSGILGIAKQNKTNIKDCSNIKSEINNYYDESIGNIYSNKAYGISTISSGIVGWINSKNININNCYVKESGIGKEKSGKISAGILGIAIRESSETGIENLIIKDCYTEKVTLRGLKTLGGIVGQVYKNEYYSVQDETSDSIVSILNCKSNSMILTGRNQSNRSVSAIIGSMCASGILQIKGCKVTDLETNDSNDSDNIGGILGVSSNTKDIFIDECSVEDIKFSTGENGSYRFCQGGMVGYIENADVIRVKDCNADNLIFDREKYKGETSSGSIIGTLGENRKYSKKSNLIMENIKVNNLKTTAEGTNNKYAYNGATGGIVGTVNYKADITLKNSDVNNIELYGNSEIGGLIGECYDVEIIKLENNKVRNIKALEEDAPAYYQFMGWKSVGGLIGNVYKFKSCSIVNTVINGSETTKISGENTGGAIGLIGSGESVNISNFKISDININSEDSNLRKKYIAAGIIGMMEVSKYNIDNVESTNVDIYSGFTSGGILGLVQIGTGNISNVNLNNSNIISRLKVTESTTTENAVGGLIGDNHNTIRSVNKIRVTDINYEGEKNVGGLFGYSNSIEKLNDVIIDGFNIKVENYGYYSVGDSKPNVGGIVGFNDGNATNINEVFVKNGKIGVKSKEKANVGGAIGYGKNTKNISLENVKFDVCHYPVSGYSDYGCNVGGIIGYAGGGKVQNCNVKSIEIIYNNDNNPATKINAGGIAGYVDNVKGCSVNDLKMNVVSGYSETGGIAGHFSNSGLINDCKVVKFTANIKANLQAIENYKNVLSGGITAQSEGNISDCIVQELEISADSIYAEIGGVIGNIAGEIINCNIETFKLENKTGKVGGIVGYSNSNIKRCKVSNGTIKALNNLQTVGGIAGNCKQNISKCEVKSVEISNIKGETGGIVGATNGNIEESNMISGTITVTSEGQNVGGITGGFSNESGEIKDCEVNSTNISNSNGYTGGIVGFSDGSILNCNFINSEVKITNDSAFGIGGILGHGKNYSTGYTYIANCNVKDSNISGYLSVGGIVGASVPYIKACTVEGSEINGMSYVGGVIGYGGDLKTTSSSYKLLPVTVTDCTLTDLKIKAANNASEVIGYNSFNGESDTITDTTASNCEVTEANKDEKDNEDVVNTQSLDEAVYTAIDEDVKKVQLNKTLE